MNNKDKNANAKAPKRGAPKDDDDVDENGNIAELIDYDYSDEESVSDSLTRSEIYHLKKYGRLPSKVKDAIGGASSRNPRKAALKAREKIRRKLSKEDNRNKSLTTTDSTYVSERHEKEEKREKKGFLPKKRMQKQKRVESESESDGESLTSHRSGARCSL